MTSKGKMKELTELLLAIAAILELLGPLLLLSIAPGQTSPPPAVSSGVSSLQALGLAFAAAGLGVLLLSRRK